jgi:hypothetical protein
MWDRIARWMSAHPKTGGRLIVMLAIAVTSYVILAGLLGTIRQSQRDGCDRGNSKALGDLRQATSDAEFANGQITYYTARHNDAQVFLWGLKVEALGDKIDSLKAVAASSGHASAEGAVTVACDRIYPDPLPLPGP